MATKRLTLVIEDADGDQSSVSIHVSSEGTETEESLLTDYLTPFWDAIRPLINGVLVDAYVSLGYSVSLFTNNTTAAISDVEEKALFSFLPCNPTARAVRFSLPTVKETIFTKLGAGREVDLTNSDVSVFVTTMTTGTDEAGISATDSHGNDLCRLEKGITLWKA